MNEPHAAYWSDRWKKGETGWDIGYPSTPIRAFIDTLEVPEIRILIPGAGNAYEAEYLWRKGFRNVFIADIAEEPLRRFHGRVPDFPEGQLLHVDFFQLDMVFDLVIEQTFYCAIPPTLRDDYVRHMAEVLRPGGILTGLLFNFPLTEEGPPFGGSEGEYRQRFAPFFDLEVLEPAENSIPPRAGRELWFRAVRRLSL